MRTPNHPVPETGRIEQLAHSGPADEAQLAELEEYLDAVQARLLPADALHARVLTQARDYVERALERDPAWRWWRADGAIKDILREREERDVR